MGQSKYKITKGKQNGYAEYPKTLVEAVFWDKKKKTLEEALESIETDTDTKLGKKMDKIVNPVTGDIVAIDNKGNAVSSGVNKESLFEFPETPGTTGQVIQLNAQGKPEWVTPSAGTTPDSEMSDTSTNAPQNKVVKKYVDDNFAKKSGQYASLVSGAALNLVGHGSVPAEYTRRTSGGPASIGSGTAQITEIRGKSIVWNQLFSGITNYSNKGITITSEDGGKLTINGTSTDDIIITLYANISVFAGHKVIIGSSEQLPEGASWSYSYNADRRWLTINTYALDVSGNFYLHINSGVTFSNFVCHYQIHDITQMQLASQIYSAPAFEALYPGFHGYNAGSILNLMAAGVLADGFNQWDEEWENKKLENGVKTENANYVCSKNFIPVIPSTEYYMANLGNYTNKTIRMEFYDINKSFLGVDYLNDTNGWDFQTLPNCYYVQFGSQVSGGMTTYNHDICINLSWSGYRNGEYEPHLESTLNLPITTMTGKAGGVGDSVVVYPNGMMSAGTAFDYGRVDADGWMRKVVKVMEEVNLGDLTWIKGSVSTDEKDIFLSDNVLQRVASNTNVLCAQFLFGGLITTQQQALNFSDGQFFLYSLDHVPGVIGVIQTHGRYADANAFKSAMAGVKLVYQLATPVEYTLDEPIFMGYQVDDFGTETMLPNQTGLSEPTSAPFRYEVQYAMNAVDTIRNLPKDYSSIESESNLLNALKTAGIIADYTRTWNSETNKYDYTFTAPSE